MARAAEQRFPPKSFEQLWDELDRVPQGYVGEIVDGEIVVMPTRRRGRSRSTRSSSI